MKINKIILISTLLSLSTACVQKESTKKSKDVPQADLPEIPETTVGPDPLLTYQWHLRNTGNNYLIGTTGKPGADINLGTLHSRGILGQGVTVAISDSDIQYNHEDLFSNFSIALSRNYLFPNPRARAPLSNLSNASHGTVVAGFIGAGMNNSVGGKGVAPRSTLAGFNYLSASTTSTTTIDQATGDNIDIFNYSYGYSTCMIITRDMSFINAITSGVSNQRAGKGSLYIKAAGNEYYAPISDCTQDTSDTSYYLGNANYDPDNTSPYTILVGALDSNGTSSQFSTPGANLWISAPGGGNASGTSPLVSTDVAGCTHGYAKNHSSVLNSFEKGIASLNSKCNYTADSSGTSFSAPIVSGVVALMLDVNPLLKWRDVKRILADTAITIGSPNTIPHPISNEALANHPYDRGLVTNAKGYNYHNYYGFGKIDATAAVAMAENYNLDLGEFIDFTVSSADINLPIPDNSSTGASHTLTNSNPLFIEAIELTLTTAGASVSDLGLELTSPSGTTITITNINSNNITANFMSTTFLVNAFYRESGLGEWTLKAIDGKTTPNATPMLKSFSLKFYGTTNAL